MIKQKKEILWVLGALVLLWSFLVAVPALASEGESEIAKEVAGMDSGTIRLSFAARENVCGDGETFISFNGSTIRWHGSGTSWTSSDSEWDDWEPDCDEGPVRVILKVRNGEVRRLKTYVGGRWRNASGNVLDLEEVSPQEAANYLVSLARHGRKSVAKDAIFPATLARDVVIWPGLLDIARDRSCREDVRKSAVFWLGQITGEKASKGLAKLADDDDLDLEVREAAIFALSQRKERKSTRHLMKIARTSPHIQLRKSALFWLAQSDDPDVLDFFEEILLEK